jgi:hypothetical protein
MALLGDADGNGSPEISLLQSDLGGRVGVEIRNVSGPAVPNYIQFD